MGIDEYRVIGSVRFLEEAAGLLSERGKEYDSPTGEKSAGKTAQAFNAITGKDLSESEVWLILLLLKQVRQWSQPGYHEDSAKDSVSYAALLAESLEEAAVAMPDGTVSIPGAYVNARV